MTLQALIANLRQYTGIAQKRAIDGVLSRFELPQGDGVPLVGDDCAVIPRADGNLLFAIEGFMNEFVAADPWFAGWCGVMVNVSDIAAMGGRPIAVVDALWSDGQDKAKPVIDGMKAASQAFGVPIVGGHSNTRAQQQLAVAVLGQADALLSSFTATPGDALVAAIDLRGQYRAPFDNWNAATYAPGERLQGDIALLPQIATDGLAHAAKDISQAGLLGTALMLMECSGVGAHIDLGRIPKPADVPMQRWLRSFPSFGYLLACKPEQVEALTARFTGRGIAAAGIGEINASGCLSVNSGTEHGVFWDLDHEPLMGVRPSAQGHSHA